MVQDCTNEEIKRFYRQAGIAVKTIPISRLFEKHVPADTVIALDGFTKVFGLQYKALHDDGYWHTQSPPGQHDTLRSFRWIRYCLSEMRSLAECSSALHLARFAIPRWVPVPTPLDNRNRYSYGRWGGIAQSLMSCSLGERIESEDDLTRVFRAFRDTDVRNLIEFYAVTGVRTAEREFFPQRVVNLTSQEDRGDQT
jgi:hypothetical protein